MFNLNVSILVSKENKEKVIEIIDNFLEIDPLQQVAIDGELSNDYNNMLVLHNSTTIAGLEWLEDEFKVNFQVLKTNTFEENHLQLDLTNY